MPITLLRAAILAWFALVALLICIGRADAGNYRNNWFWHYNDLPWCLNTGDGLNDCAYATFAQCNYSRNGTGGSCNPNPRYPSRAQSARRPQPYGAYQ